MDDKMDASRVEGGGSSEKARILATDDRPDAFDLIERSLGQSYECRFATHIGAALDKLERQPFELALCSIQSPDEWGVALIEKITRTYPDTAVVVVAAVDDLRVVEQALRLGACGYVSKPLWSGKLIITTANALRQQQLKVAARETAECLACAIELHNPSARRHLATVASTAALLATELGLGPDRVTQIRAAAPLHDIGTVATPAGVLYRREGLTASERERLEAHTTVGHDFLADASSELLAMAARIALTHHERFDGKGYPRQLCEDEIPIEGRIVAVVDTFDALLSDRPHRPAFTAPEAIERIVQDRGTRFDPQVVDALVENLDEALGLRDTAAK